MRSIIATLILSSIAWSQESAPATNATLTRAAMEADLDALETAVREKWSYLDDRQANFGVDLAALVKRAKSGLPETGDRRVFHGILHELVADLQDGHGHVATPGVLGPARRWPVTLKEFADGVFIVKATGDLAAPVGARVLEVDGAPIEDAIAAATRRAIASTPAARRAVAIESLVRTPAPSVRLTMSRSGEDGAREVLTAATLATEPLELLTWTDGPVWSVDRPRPGVARLRVRSFAVDRWADWLVAKQEDREGFLAETRALIDRLFLDIAGSKALIIDLRDNAGGTDLLGIHLAKHLLARRFIYFHLSALRGGKWSKPHGYEHDALPVEQRFDGPIALLVDERCFSTTDNFLRAVIENRRDVIVVGRPTNGGTGAPNVVATLQNSKTSVTLCTQRVGGPNGTLTEGRGTKPTIPVRWTSADYFGGRDPDMAAALDALDRAASRASSR